MLVSLYNSALISWNLLYLGQSFDYPPPWEQCKMTSHIHRITNRTGKERDREMGWLQELSEAPCEVTRKYLNLRPLLPPRVSVPSDSALPVLLVSHNPSSLQPSGGRD